MTYQNITEYGERLLEALKTVDMNFLEFLSSEISERMNNKGEIFIVGNGGSAANAHHISGDYLKTFALIGKLIKISCLSDNTCYLTAAANDVELSEIMKC